MVIGCAARAACAASVAEAARTAPRVALVIGNGAYRGTDRLVSPTDDAELIAQSLRVTGFSVDLEENRTRAQLLGDLDTFGRAAAKASIALVYYAGHGFEMGGENYLIPGDMPVPIGQVSQADLMRFALPLRYVQGVAARGEPRALVLLLDACRSGAARGGATPTMAPVQAAHGTLIAFATQPGGAALDSFSIGSVRHQHSPFAYYLSRRVVPSAEVEMALRATQVDVSVATNDAQRPWYNNGLMGNLTFGDGSAAQGGLTVIQRQQGGERGGTRGIAGGAGETAASEAQNLSTASLPGMPPLLEGETTQVADERAQAREWRGQSLRMEALVIQAVVNPQVTAQLRKAARQGDLFSMTTLALSLLSTPPGLPDEEIKARVAEGTLYMNAASDGHYPMADAARAGWLFAHGGDPAEVVHYFRAAVDHGYAESLPRLIQLLTITGDGNLNQYLALYRRIYGRDYDYTNAAR